MHKNSSVSNLLFASRSLFLYSQDGNKRFTSWAWLGHQSDSKRGEMKLSWGGCEWESRHDKTLITKKNHLFFLFSTALDVSWGNCFWVLGKKWKIRVTLCVGKCAILEVNIPFVWSIFVLIFSSSPFSNCGQVTKSSRERNSKSNKLHACLAQ